MKKLYIKFLEWLWYFGMLLDGIIGILSFTIVRPRINLKIAVIISKLKYSTYLENTKQ